MWAAVNRPSGCCCCGDKHDFCFGKSSLAWSYLFSSSSSFFSLYRFLPNISIPRCSRDIKLTTLTDNLVEVTGHLSDCFRCCYTVTGRHESPTGDFIGWKSSLFGLVPCPVVGVSSRLDSGWRACFSQVNSASNSLIPSTFKLALAWPE